MNLVIVNKIPEKPFNLVYRNNFGGTGILPVAWNEIDKAIQSNIYIGLPCYVTSAIHPNFKLSVVKSANSKGYRLISQ